MSDTNQKPKKQNNVTRKKINPYLLEARARAQFNIIMFAVIAVIFSFMYYKKSGDPMDGLLVILFVAAVFIVYILGVFFVDKTGRRLRKDLKTQNTVAIPMELMEARGERRFGKMTMVNGYFSESIFYRTQFFGQPLDNKTFETTPLRFILDSKRDQQAHGAYAAALKDENAIKPLGMRPYTFTPESYEKTWNYFHMIVTEEKINLLNRWFALDYPTEVEVVCYEQSHVFQCFRPIEGRDYPEEVLEIMERLNHMYP
ncbi:MAG: hypothetical protein U0M15_02420 [Bacillota bacterium]|nr:hypothetical protein [Bacillota bacterium]